MGVDFGKVKDKQQAMDEKAAQRAAGGYKYWSPTVGKNSIRILPPWTDEGPNANQFDREVYMHWNIGPEEKGATFPCPEKTPNGPGGGCPICEYVAALRASGDPADAEMAGDSAAKVRHYSNVIDLDDPVYVAKDLKEWKEKHAGGGDCPYDLGDSKVQIFSYGSMIYKDLLDIFADNIDITDPQSGYDVVIKREGTGKTSTKYRVHLDLGKGACPLEFTGDLAKGLIDLDAVSTFKDYTTMQNALNGTTPAEPQETLPPARQQAAPALPAAAEVEDDEEPPECFKDDSVFDPQDAECAGGEKEGDEYDACPFFSECQAACQPKKAKRRGRKAATVPSPEDAAVSALEAEMQNAVK